MITIHDTKNSVNCKFLSEVLEAAQNSNFQGIKEANICCSGRQMLTTLKLLMPELRGLAKFGHIHESLLKRVENSISLAERGSEIHQELPNGNYAKEATQGRF